MGRELDESPAWAIALGASFIRRSFRAAPFASSSGGSAASAPPQPLGLGSAYSDCAHMRQAKLQLWKHLSRTRAGRLSGLPMTKFWQRRSDLSGILDAAVTLSRDRNGFLQRGKGYGQLRQRWSKQPPQRLLVFHHYDSRGLLPQSWREALVSLQAAGWQVVLSSPYVDSAVSAWLEPAGVEIVGRDNIGLCLGAYRDLALLLHSTREAQQHLKALVLCNDSNLLVQPPDALLALGIGRPITPWRGRFWLVY